MIALPLLAALLQAVPAAGPSFGYFCELEGTLGLNDEPTQFPQPRRLALLMKQNKAGSVTPVRTLDPSKLLGGKQITIFLKSGDGSRESYAFTSLPSADDGAVMISMSPSDSRTVNEWNIGIGPAKRQPKSTLAIGYCLLMDGLSDAEFEEQVQDIETAK